MYGPEDEDPVVMYYDETLAISGESELRWYLEKVKLCGGPVLDLACGTGRIALLLLREGFDVACIDSSEGMLHVFRKKLQKEPAGVRKRAFIQKSDMSDFHIDRKFSTIFCCDAFFHNVTVQEEINCLRCVASHLKHDGRFLFNIPNPDFTFLLRCAGPEGKLFRERDEYPLKSGGRVRIEESCEADLAEQTIVTKLRYTVIDKGVKSKESWWKIRYLFPFEAEHLLYRCGFEVESVVGDYNNGPVTRKSQLIFQAILSE